MMTKLVNSGIARLAAVVAAVLACAASAATKPDPKEIERQEVIARARTECYKDDYRTVYDAVFNAVRSQFSDIAKESERLGEIVTEWSETTKQELDANLKAVEVPVRSRVAVELKGRDCSTVLIRSETEKQVGGSWVADGKDVSVEDALYYAMYNAIIASRPRDAAPAVEESASNSPPAATGVGSEGGNCYPNETCDPGLTCASNICVVLKAGPAEGAEGGACYANKTCDKGLTCASNFCVKSP